MEKSLFCVKMDWIPSTRFVKYIKHPTVVWLLLMENVLYLNLLTNLIYTFFLIKISWISDICKYVVLLKCSRWTQDASYFTIKFSHHTSGFCLLDHGSKLVVMSQIMVQGPPLNIRILMSSENVNFGELMIKHLSPVKLSALFPGYYVSS